MNRLIPLLVLAAITTSASALEVTGRWIQGGFISGTVAPGSTVRLGKAPVLVAPDGRFAFGLAFDAALAELERRAERPADDLFAGKVEEANAALALLTGPAAARDGRGPEPGCVLPAPAGLAVGLGAS